MFKIIRTIGDITRTIQIDSNNHFKEFILNYICLFDYLFISS